MMMKRSESNGKLAVLMISPQFRPIVGGYERAVERLSAALADAGVSVSVVTERRERAWPAMERIDGYQVHRLQCLYRRHFHAVTAMTGLAVFLVSYGRRFDVWHLHGYGPHGVVAVGFGKLLGRPVALKFTSSAEGRSCETLARKLVERVMGAFHRRVSLCFAVSEEIQQVAEELGIPSARIARIPNGLDGREYSPAGPAVRGKARLALGLQQEKVIAFVGRLSPEKNPLGLLEAWGLLSERLGNDAVLTMVGDGPERGVVELRAKRPDLAGRVKIAGERADVPLWLRAADLCVIPSLREGLSNVMLEALASGVPVVSTRVSGSGVLLRPPAAGRLVEIGDTVGLAAAIGDLLEDDVERQRLSENARRKFEEEFALGAVVKKQIAAYERLVGGGAHRAAAEVGAEAGGAVEYGAPSERSRPAS